MCGNDHSYQWNHFKLINFKCNQLYIYHICFICILLLLTYCYDNYLVLLYYLLLISLFSTCIYTLMFYFPFSNIPVTLSPFSFDCTFSFLSLFSDCILCSYYMLSSLHVFNINLLSYQIISLIKILFTNMYIIKCWIM